MVSLSNPERVADGVTADKEREPAPGAEAEPELEPEPDAEGAAEIQFEPQRNQEPQVNANQPALSAGFPMVQVGPLVEPLAPTLANSEEPVSARSQLSGVSMHSGSGGGVSTSSYNFYDVADDCSLDYLDNPSLAGRLEALKAGNLSSLEIPVVAHPVIPELTGNPCKEPYSWREGGFLSNRTNSSERSVSKVMIAGEIARGFVWALLNNCVNHKSI